MDDLVAQLRKMATEAELDALEAYFGEHTLTVPQRRNLSRLRTKAAKRLNPIWAEVAGDVAAG